MNVQNAKEEACALEFFNGGEDDTAKTALRSRYDDIEGTLTVVAINLVGFALPRTWNGAHVDYRVGLGDKIRDTGGVAEIGLNEARRCIV